MHKQDKQISTNSEVPVDVTYLVVLGFVIFAAWITLKIFIRVLKSMLRPMLYTCFAMIVFFTFSFSRNDSLGDFIVNIISNTAALLDRILEILRKIVLGPAKEL